MPRSPLKSSSDLLHDTSSTHASRINELQLLHSVQEHQKDLVERVNEKQRWANQRRHLLGENMSELRRREAEDSLDLERRKQTLDAEEKELVAARQRLDAMMARLENRRRDLDEYSVHRAREHEKARSVLDQEATDLSALERHIEELRSEISAHAREAEQRYLRRLEEAEQTRRRWEEDEREVTQLEEKLRSYRGGILGAHADEALSRVLSSQMSSAGLAQEGSNMDEEVMRIQRDISMMEQRLAADPLNHTTTRGAAMLNNMSMSSHTHASSPARGMNRSFGGMRSPPKRTSGY
eukprot:PhM_4_TR17552/c0_g1_i1/m.34734